MGSGTEPPDTTLTNYTLLNLHSSYNLLNFFKNHFFSANLLFLVVFFHERQQTTLLTELINNQSSNFLIFALVYCI